MGVAVGPANPYAPTMTTPAAGVDLDTLRETIQTALLDFATVTDDVLERPWEWPEHGELEVRYGFFHTLLDLEGTAAEISRSGDDRTRARSIITPTAVAAWDLVALLATLDEDDLDRDPGGGEWTARRAISHMLTSQRSYAIYTDWWRQQRLPADTRPVPEPPDDLDAPDQEEIAADGSLGDLRRRIHAYIDEAAVRLADLDDAELDLLGRWSELPVTIAFRQGRWSPHIAEHTIQVDKTLVMLGRRPTEVDRLLRRVGVAWGAIESTLWPIPANDAALSLAAAAAARTAATAADVKATAARG